MLNQVILVGKLQNEVVIEKMENGEKAIITVAVPRAYKNQNGEYETDYIDVVLWHGIATSTEEYCHKGDTIGIKGRVQTILEDGKPKQMIIIAEKITFLSANPSLKKEEE